MGGPRSNQRFLMPVVSVLPVLGIPHVTAAVPRTRRAAPKRKASAKLGERTARHVAREPVGRDTDREASGDGRPRARRTREASEIGGTPKGKERQSALGSTDPC